MESGTKKCIQKLLISSIHLSPTSVKFCFVWAKLLKFCHMTRKQCHFCNTNFPKRNTYIFANIQPFSLKIGSFQSPKYRKYISDLNWWVLVRMREYITIKWCIFFSCLRWFRDKKKAKNWAISANTALISSKIDSFESPGHIVLL